MVNLRLRRLSLPTRPTVFAPFPTRLNLKKTKKKQKKRRPFRKQQKARRRKQQKARRRILQAHHYPRRKTSNHPHCRDIKSNSESGGQAAHSYHEGVDSDRPVSLREHAELIKTRFLLTESQKMADIHTRRMGRTRPGSIQLEKLAEEKTPEKRERRHST